MKSKTKHYFLKPGKHQFAPGSAPVHSNDNLTDAEAKWYLKRYPHIRPLFAQLPDAPKPKTIRQPQKEATI
jgi:hypothetical protein